jgi:antitoxin ParD1/3/4
MAIALTPTQEQRLQQLVDKGHYDSLDTALAEALELLEERDRQYEQWVAETRQQLQVGITELDRGEGLDSEVVIERLQEKLQQARERSLPPSR